MADPASTEGQCGHLLCAEVKMGVDRVKMGMTYLLHSLFRGLPLHFQVEALKRFCWRTGLEMRRRS